MFKNDKLWCAKKQKHNKSYKKLKYIEEEITYY